MTIVELVRHADAGRRAQWNGPDDQRPLDDSGRAQAAALAEALAPGPPVSAVLSSAYTRCVQTVEPLAAALGLEVGVDEALEEVREVPVTDGGTAWVTAAWLAGRMLALFDRLLATEPQRVVLCSHGDIIPAVMAALVARDGLPIADVRCRKGGRFRLRFEDRRCVEAVVLRPSEQEPGL